MKASAFYSLQKGNTFEQNGPAYIWNRHWCLVSLILLNTFKGKVRKLNTFWIKMSNSKCNKIFYEITSYPSLKD
jgi:hypothetical protein